MKASLEVKRAPAKPSRKKYRTRAWIPWEQEQANRFKGKHSKEEKALKRASTIISTVSVAKLESPGKAARLFAWILQKTLSPFFIQASEAERAVLSCSVRADSL